MPTISHTPSLSLLCQDFIDDQASYGHRRVTEESETSCTPFVHSSSYLALSSLPLTLCWFTQCLTHLWHLSGRSASSRRKPLELFSPRTVRLRNIEFPNGTQPSPFRVSGEATESANTSSSSSTQYLILYPSALMALCSSQATNIQKHWRGFCGRRVARIVKNEHNYQLLKVRFDFAATVIQVRPAAQYPFLRFPSCRNGTAL